MKYSDLRTRKIIDINGQVVKKKSPWPKVISALLVTILVIFILYKVNPSFEGKKSFLKNLNNFFNYDDIHIGRARVTIGETFSKSINLLWKTILYSILGTVIGIVISIPLALFSSKNIVRKWYIYTPFRIVMSIIRAVPPLIVAFLLFNIFSKTLSATLAISVFVSTIMTKWLFEELDSIDLESHESLQALGVSKNRSITKSVFPYLMRSIMYYGVYAFEMVIRFATILGVVGITTIGALLSDKYRKIDRWGHMAVVLIILIFTIIIIEILTMLFNKYVINKREKQLELDGSKIQRISMVKDSKSRPVLKTILLIIFGALLVIAFLQVEWKIANPTKITSFKHGINDLFHPEWSFITEFGTGVNAITLGLEGLLVSAAAVIIGLFFALIFGALASKNIVGPYISLFFKLIIISIRSIPGFVYAIIFIFLSPQPNLAFAGVLALGVHSIGMLGKMTYEKIDSIDPETRNSLEVMGSSRILSTKWALISEAIPSIMSNAFYRLEINFKSLVEIGSVGASSFGLQISIYSGDPTKFSWLAPYLIVTIVIVLFIEQLSNIFRNRIRTGSFIKADSWIYKQVEYYRIINALTYSKLFDLKFSKNQQELNKINIIGSKLVKNNKEEFKNTKLKINKELSKLNDTKLKSLERYLQKYV